MIFFFSSVIWPSFCLTALRFSVKIWISLMQSECPRLHLGVPTSQFLLNFYWIPHFLFTQQNRFSWFCQIIRFHHLSHKMQCQQFCWKCKMWCFSGTLNIIRLQNSLNAAHKVPFCQFSSRKRDLNQDKLHLSLKCDII